jgi:UDP-N-acetylglucosamine pyrophosphorylase
MTSKSNDLATRTFFEENNYFDYPKDKIYFFVQDYMPVLDLDGNLLLCEPYAIKEESNGNGNVYKSLYKNNILSNMKKDKIKWIFMSGIDNVLLELVDPIFIGLTANKKCQIASKTIFKEDPSSKECVFCMKNNKPTILNYNYITNEISMAKNQAGNFLYREMNVLSHLFTIEALEKVSNIELPYHRAFKKNVFVNDEGMKQIPEYNNSYKFETFIFDAFEYFNNILLLRIEKDEFAPIKDTFGLNSPDIATKLYIKQQNNKK